MLIAVIIILFWNRIPWFSVIDKEACHNSVLARGGVDLGFIKGTQQKIPLRCKTSETTIATKDDAQIKRIIANEMYDCWWMLGEGKVDFIGDSGWKNWGIPVAGASQAVCVICSTIKFDEKSKGKEIELLKYFEENNIPGGDITYLEYFSGGTETKLEPQLRLEKVDTNKDYAVIFLGMKGGNVGEMFARWGFGAVTSAGPAAGFTIKMLLKVGLKTITKVGGWVTFALAVAELGGHITNLIIDSNTASIYCDGNQGGCYALILTPLDAEGLQQNCQNIASIP